MKASYRFGRFGYRAPLLALGLTALSFLPAPFASAQAAPTEPQRRLTVTGQGEVKVKPDTAVITIGVVTEDKSSQNAVRANAEASQKVQAAIKGAGIAEKDIQTSNYSVQPIYEQIMLGGFGERGFIGQDGRFVPSKNPVVLPNGVTVDGDAPAGLPKPPVRQRPAIVGYRVYNQVRVSVHDIAKLSSIIDAATGAGSNSIEGIHFTKENQTEIENEALAKAVADARRKADQLAKAADIEIRGVWEINESGINRPPWPMYAMARADAAGASTPIQPGEISVTANVTIVYQLGPGRFRQAGKGIDKTPVRLKAARR